MYLSLDRPALGTDAFDGTVPKMHVFNASKFEDRALGREGDPRKVILGTRQELQEHADANMAHMKPVARGESSGSSRRQPSTSSPA